MNSMIKTKAFWLLFVGCLIGWCAVLPYAFALAKTSVNFTALQWLISLTSNAAVFGFAIWIGLTLAVKNGFRIHLLQLRDGLDLRTEILVPGAIAGVVVAAAITFFEYVMFSGVMPESLHLSVTAQPLTLVPAGLLASLYGAINEEVTMRLFLVSLVIWLMRAVTKKEAPSLVVWISIILTALLFGLGHLPATRALVPLTASVVARALVLNGIAGVVFGWLFWKKSLETAMWAHFITDILLHGAVPLCVALLH